MHHDQVARGDALVRPRQWEPTRVFDARLHVLGSLDHAVSRRGAYHAYIARVSTRPSCCSFGSDSEPSRPGNTGLVRLHLPVELPLLPGDRFVVRESGRAETVGGGEVLDVAPVLPASRAAPTLSVDRVVAERGWVDADELDV